MYNLPMPASVIRTRMREEFERNRLVNKLSVVDVLLFKSHAEYQVRSKKCQTFETPTLLTWAFTQQEMMNFWKQTTHVLSYFKGENFRGDKRLPSNFMEGFLQVCDSRDEFEARDKFANMIITGTQLVALNAGSFMYILALDSFPFVTKIQHFFKQRP